MTRNRIRDQRVIYLNGRRWSTAVLARGGRPVRASYVGPGSTPAVFLTATAGMYGHAPRVAADFRRIDTSPADIAYDDMTRAWSLTTSSRPIAAPATRRTTWHAWRTPAGKAPSD